jgi:hypothetical protein
VQTRFCLSVAISTAICTKPPDRHCAVSGARHVSRPLAFVGVDHWIRSLPDCPVLQHEGACLQPLCVDCPVVPPDSLVRTGHVLFTVRCATRRWLTAFSRVSLLIPSGFFCSWVLDFYASFYVFFWGVASLLPKSNPLRILWTTIINSSKHIIPQMW